MLMHGSYVWLVMGKICDEAIKEYQKGKKITVKILDIDPKKERVVLGVKQLTDDPFEIQAWSRLRRMLVVIVK